MREIKFRAWGIDGTGPLKMWPWEHIRSCFDVWMDEEIVMQFTGLHDKNGKEIYEGDVVYREVLSADDTARGVYGYRGIVTYEDGQFVVKCDEDYSFYDHMGSLFSWGELEVIGNIYENKELLS